MADFLQELHNWIIGNDVYHIADSCEASAGWSNIGANTYDPTPDSNDYIEGTASLKTGNSASGQTSIGHSKILDNPLNMERMEFGIFTKVEDISQLSSTGAVIIYAGTDNVANVYFDTFPASAITEGEWCRVGKRLTDMNILGQPDIRSINYISAQWQFANTSVIIPLGDIKFDYINYGPAEHLASSATFYNKMPATPNLCVALFDAGGANQAHSPMQRRSIRILVRGANRSEGMDLANQAHALLHDGAGSALYKKSLTRYKVESSSVIAPVQQIGIDENSYLLLGFDVELITKEIN